MAYLVLVRHGQSLYNEKGLWTGWKNPDLTERGKEEAIAAGNHLRDIHVDYAFVSTLVRAQTTLDIILRTMHQEAVPIEKNSALNERSYGEYEGRNKWEIQKSVGNETFQKIRRSWDFPIPNGESLKQVYEREIPYVTRHILPKVEQGKNVLVSAHGNSLRALVKYLEKIPDEDVTKLEIATGEVYVYELDNQGRIMSKEIRKTKV